MDCSITTNYIKEKVRMSKYDTQTLICTTKCQDCPLSSYNNDKDLTCQQFEKEYPEDAIAIVQKWSDEHQRKTYADDFFKKFPHAQKEFSGVPKCCRANVYGRVENWFCADISCYECWNEAMPE